MKILTTQVKISNSLESGLFSQISSLKQLLKQGNLHEFEAQLGACLTDIQNQVSQLLMEDVATQLQESLIEQAQQQGGRKLAIRPLSIRLVSGHCIKVPSPYVKQAKQGWSGGRHMLARYWGVLGGASPGLYDKVRYCAALGPSYELAHQTLSKFGVQLCQSSVRQLTNQIADYCYEHGEENLMLFGGETLANKRVVISLDGGRTRTRYYTGQFTDSGYEQYKTPWCEPKLFVIDVLDESGQPDRLELPLYGGRFEQEDLFELLKSYLKRLQIDQADQVQIIGDGAPWIWNHVRRIINLRFKNAATFWDKTRVEKLFCLRAALLSKRWDNLISDLANAT